MNNIMIIDGHKAVIAYDPEINMFRGDFVGLNGGAIGTDGAIIVNSDKPVGDAMRPSEALQAHCSGSISPDTSIGG